MLTINVEGKQYELKRRMTTYEVRQLSKTATKFEGIDELIEADPEEAKKTIMSTTPEEETFMDVIIANCLGMDKEQVPKEMEFIHEILVFAAIAKESVPQKNLLSPSKKPMIGTTSKESPTFLKQ